METINKNNRKQEGRYTHLGFITVVTAIVAMFASPVLNAAGKTHTVPDWRVNGGERVLLAANGNGTIRRPSRNFDHLLTGFPLFGAHVNVECGDCHQHGILRGTPTRCDQCHGHPGQRASTYKPANHIPTNQPCDQCHNENIWAGSKFDHSAVAPGTCATCHNGGKAMGKPSGHVATNLACDECHRTTGWIPAQFKHSNVAPGTCDTCHGVTATGKPSGHPVTTEQCDSCHHSTTSWLPASFDHSGVAPGTCDTCHGVTATGKPSGHPVTTAQCDQCHHSTTSWLPADYDHSGVVPGTCTSCHGVWASGKPADHIPAPMSCDECHNTSTFGTSTMRNHDPSQGVVPGGCLLCHNGAYTSQGARGLPRDHKPSTVTTCDGSGCHSTRTWSK
jgi:hypothetical protein